MDPITPNPLDVAAERLRAQIALAHERLAEADRDLEVRGRALLVAETPVADHAYRVARDRRAGLRTRVQELQAELGRLILEREGLGSRSLSA